MGSRKRKHRRGDQGEKPVTQPSRGSSRGLIVTLVVGVAIMAALLFLILPRDNQQPAARDVAPAIPAAAAPTAVQDQVSPPTVPKSGLDALRGKWSRPDGGYIIDIASVNNNGKLDASYFNPRRINVAKAEASQDGTALRVFIELRDVNYPGSTYNLTYEPDSDSLRGIYYQALQQQQFEVVFVRMQ